MSKRKVVEDLKNGKKGKITSFFSKEQTVCGKFKMSLHLSLHTVRSADRVIDEFVDLSKISSFSNSWKHIYSLEGSVSIKGR